jgi:flagellar biosynthesis anti-sigma factor FlgM
VNNIPSGGKDGQGIQNLGFTAGPRRPASPKGVAGEGPAVPATSSLHVSAGGERFVSLRARLEGLEAPRSERVEQLRQLVSEGRYRPDAGAVAGAMLADPATAAALGIS